MGLPRLFTGEENTLKAGRTLFIGLWSLLGLTLLIAVFPPIWNVDIFWHMATGQWILETGGLPSTDVFSAITTEREWHPFQWLYEVIVSLLDDVFDSGVCDYSRASSY